ncbi:MAG: FmdB family zinc ribbon protein [Candidatus Rifleibacteriota bacterium]
MPLYEYACADCKRKFTVLTSIDKRDEPKECANCGNKNSRRLVSKFKTVRSEEQIMESLADPSKLAGIDENDPSSMASWAKKMAREMGENMDDEIDAMAEDELSGNGDTSEDSDSGFQAPPEVDDQL